MKELPMQLASSGTQSVGYYFAKCNFCSVHLKADELIGIIGPEHFCLECFTKLKIPMAIDEEESDG